MEKRKRAKTPSLNSTRVLDTILKTTLFRDDQSTNSDLLPIDLIMEIFKLLPVKTLVRFLCLSKLWASIIRRRYFKKLFITNSTKRPERLFFSMTTADQRHRSFFSFQTHNTREASLATYRLPHLSYPYSVIYSSVHDLFCYKTKEKSYPTDSGLISCYRLVVYSTSTSIFITLPMLDSPRVFRLFLCYDPIDDVYKVLCMTKPRLGSEAKRVIQVLTLGNENSWKMIEDTHAHYSPTKLHICINGVLYYEAYTDISTERREIVVMSFNVRSEKIDLINGPPAHLLLSYSPTMMIRYEGKLAIASRVISPHGSIVLWVLKDAVKHEWSKIVFDFPWTSIAPCQCAGYHNIHRFVDVTDAGEFILVPIHMCIPPFYVIYYDPEKNSMKRVEIEGIMEFVQQPEFPTYISSSQVESLLML